MNRKPEWNPRRATEADIPAIAELIPESVRGLQAGFYSGAQREAALGPVFAVDRQLIGDGTLFVAVVEASRRVVGCGGWSRRETFFGGDDTRKSPGRLLVPGVDAARVRAFFVHPDFARQGIGRALLIASEIAIKQEGFTRIELAATLAGEPLYAAAGYEELERFDIAMPGGLALPCVRMAKKL